MDGENRRDNQSIDSLLRTDALLAFAQMSLLNLLSIMILCFVDFLDSPIPCISLNFFFLWSFTKVTVKLSHLTHIPSTKAITTRHNLRAVVPKLLSHHNHDFGSLEVTTLQYLERFEKIAHSERIVF